MYEECAPHTAPPPPAPAEAEEDRATQGPGAGGMLRQEGKTCFIWKALPTSLLAAVQPRLPPAGFRRLVAPSVGTQPLARCLETQPGIDLPSGLQTTSQAGLLLQSPAPLPVPLPASTSACCSLRPSPSSQLPPLRYSPGTTSSRESYLNPCQEPFSVLSSARALLNPHPSPQGLQLLV